MGLPAARRVFGEQRPLPAPELVLLRERLVSPCPTFTFWWFREGMCVSQVEMITHVCAAKTPALSRVLFPARVLLLPGHAAALAWDLSPTLSLAGRKHFPSAAVFLPAALAVRGHGVCGPVTPASPSHQCPRHTSGPVTPAAPHAPWPGRHMCVLCRVFLSRILRGQRTNIFNRHIGHFPHLGAAGCWEDILIKINGLRKRLKYNIHNCFLQVHFEGVKKILEKLLKLDPSNSLAYRQEKGNPQYSTGWRGSSRRMRRICVHKGWWVGEHRLKLPLVVLCKVLVLLTLQSVNPVALNLF